MISLKKNDKIIIVAAVVVILLASIGIAMYTSPEPVIPTGMGNIDENTYEVEWTTYNGSLTKKSEFAGKRSPYETTVQISEGNLQSITFNMSWVDDHTTFLKRFGLDRLTLEVTTPDGDITEETGISAAKTREGNILYTVYNRDYRPPDTMTANDVQAAQEKLKETPFYDDSWTNKDITIKVTVTIGEKRILAKLFDKGNSFDLDITYSYAKAVLKDDETKGTGDTLPPDDDLWEEPPYMSMIINTGCGRYV